MLALCLQAWFRDEPRVEIRPTIAKHTYERFGSNLIGMTHGDTIKRGGVGLDSLMAADRAKDWGETTKSILVHRAHTYDQQSRIDGRRYLGELPQFGAQ
jgi:hypothetical protein